tara:strand:+ start:1079 stop:1444 length:366 start_codon:yes stop_codon:yes gene_type:complete
MPPYYPGQSFEPEIWRNYQHFVIKGYAVAKRLLHDDSPSHYSIDMLIKAFPLEIWHRSIHDRIAEAKSMRWEGFDVPPATLDKAAKIGFGTMHGKHALCQRVHAWLREHCFGVVIPSTLER